MKTLWITLSLLFYAIPAIAQNSGMHMLYTKTIFQIKILTLDIQFDQKTQDRLNALTDGKSYSDERADEVVKTVAGASNISIQMHILRDLSFNRFLSETSDSETCAFQAHAVDKAEYDRVINGLPNWFAPLRERGVLSGDQMSYEIDQNGLKTFYRTHDGQTLVSQSDSGVGPRSSVLGSYFSKCSNFREDLVKSAFKN